MRISSRLRPAGVTGLVAVALLCIFAIAFLVLEVARDWNRLRTAASDNVQWNLSQTEIEYLDMQRAAEAALQPGAGRLDDVRTEFDLFYSRIATLENGALYADLRATRGFADALQALRGFLDASVPLIDAPDDVLQQNLPQFVEQAAALRPTVRALTTAGLGYFVSLADQNRDAIATTLLRLAMVTAALVLALALVARHATAVSRRTRDRERQVASANARLNTILETSLDGVVVSDIEGRIMTFNAAAESIFGWCVEEVRGRRIGDVMVPPHLRAAHETGMTRMKTTGETRVVGHGRVQLEAQRRDGAIFPVELALQMAEADGEKIVVAFLRDISQRVADERELIDARDRALAGEKAKADFLAVMTHEIRTPLNGVLGNLDLLKDTTLDDRQRRYVRDMQVSGRMLMQHVDAVLDIARFESGQMRFAADPVHLPRLLQDIVDSQAGFAAANGNRLRWAFAGAPLDWVQTDRARLDQVLLNLVGNAIKFTRDGTIEIEVEALPDRDAQDRPLVEFRVIDTGMGIADSDQARIFDDFQTFDASFGRITGGTGLGLGIARRIVTGMGGEIGVESVLGAGSVFWLRLPMPACAEPADTRAHPPAAPLQNVALDVLLVEDNDINLHVACDMLEKLGHRVTVARNGLEALDSAARKRFDVILMDISMPVMDGLEATRLLRERGGPSAQVPIIALSANVLPEARERVAAAGMTNLLGKPVRLADLAAALAGLPQGAAPGTDVSTIDLTALAETRAQLGETVFGTLHARFRNESATLVDWLQNHPTDRSEIARRCHQVAGSAATFGATGFRDALLRIEQAAHDAEPGDLTDVILGAARAWQATCHAQDRV